MLFPFFSRMALLSLQRVSKLARKNGAKIKARKNGPRWKERQAKPMSDSGPRITSCWSVHLSLLLFFGSFPFHGRLDGRTRGRTDGRTECLTMMRVYDNELLKVNLPLGLLRFRISTVKVMIRFFS